jgi:hypothetical protein
MRLFDLWVIPMIGTLSLTMSGASGQGYPEPSMNQSFVPPSPNAQAFAMYNDNPVALYEGTPAIAIPVYTVRCGSLTLPISLSYNNNGLFALQDASWVGLGWNLNAGGMISRMIEGQVDNSEHSGYNYGQYNLADTLSSSHNLSNFFSIAYNNQLVDSGYSYDLAPDIFDAEFNGYSNKFVWVNNQAYMMTWDKDFGVSWPSPTGNITITTADGTIYTFGAKETSTNFVYGGGDSASQNYPSAWCLTQVVSADHKDTIILNYAIYYWTQIGVSYQTSYIKSTGSQADLGSGPVSYAAYPTTTMQVLQSIQCRNTRVSFIVDSTARTDIIANMPRLREIDVIDSLTGNLVKKNTLSYEYFGLASTYKYLYERLALKTFSSINPSISSDSLTYVFKYQDEYVTPWPAKDSASMDYWGYCNGPTLGGSILPANGNTFYSPAPGGVNMGSANRTPGFTYALYGALDTIVYPTGGYTAFQYEQNQFYNSSLGGNIVGPGICVQSATTVSNNPTSPQTITKNYTYLADNGTSSSGVIGNLPYIDALPFVQVTSGGTYNYNDYIASSNSGGIGGTPAKFYYSKVTESITSNGETHKTDHYFTSFPEMFLDVRETKRIDYLNVPGTSIFNPVTQSVTSYYSNPDDSFATATAYIDSQYTTTGKNAYQGVSATWYWSYWIYASSVQTTQYDVNGNTLVNTINYNFNPATRNLAYATQTTSNGQTIKEKFKYPEDYSSGLTGSMVTARVLRPVLEKQTWMYPSSNDSLLISGLITQFDQTIFMPTSLSTIELTSPIPVLNNETVSGGLYTTLISDSRYVVKEQLQYDANANLSVSTKASDMNVSYIWDYKHCKPIANVKNASQADIAYTSFEADGTGNWTFSGSSTASANSLTGNMCYNLAQVSGNITKSGLTSSTTYVVSYWISTGSPLTITGTISGYPIKGKTITVGGTSWTYYEHKITGQTSVTLSGTGYLDEVRLYPSNAQMTTFTFQSGVGMSSMCDVDNRVTYYLYDGFRRLKVVLDQDRNVIKTYQYHTQGETAE